MFCKNNNYQKEKQWLPITYILSAYFSSIWIYCLFATYLDCKYCLIDYVNIYLYEFPLKKILIFITEPMENQYKNKINSFIIGVREIEKMLLFSKS